MMDWLCVISIFANAGLLLWALYLHGQVEQRQGRLDKTQSEIDWVKANCAEEWNKIGKAMLTKGRF